MDTLSLPMTFELFADCSSAYISSSVKKEDNCSLAHLLCPVYKARC